MHAFQLRACLLTILLVLMLTACNSDSISEKPETRVLPSQHVHITATVPPGRKTDSAADPIQLSIPTLAINAPIEWVGTQANADLATPTHNPWEGVGWYDLGPHPGERGSAVIDGHLDRPGGFPAVFWRLSYVRVGDEVLVKNASGKTLHFRVTRIAFYSPQEAPIQDIFGNWGGFYLNLITCAGDWIPSQHQTNQRLVVYTSLAKA